MSRAHDLSKDEFYLDFNKPPVKWAEVPDEKKLELLERTMNHNTQLQNEVEYLRRLCIAQATQKDPEEKRY